MWLNFVLIVLICLSMLINCQRWIKKTGLQEFIKLYLHDRMVHFKHWIRASRRQRQAREPEGAVREGVEQAGVRGWPHPRPGGQGRGQGQQHGEAHHHHGVTHKGSQIQKEWGSTRLGDPNDTAALVPWREEPKPGRGSVDLRMRRYEPMWGHV